MRLAVGIADAIPHEMLELEPGAVTADPLAPPPAGPFASSSPEPAPPRPERRRGLRGQVARWLRRPAEYARAYLTASLTHQLQLQASRTSEIQVRVGALEAMDGRLAELLVETRSVSLRLDDMERRQLAQTSRLEGIERRQATAEAWQATVDDWRPQLDEVGRRVGSLQDIGADLLTLSQGNTRLGMRAVEQLDAAIGVLGPRFDQLDTATTGLREAVGVLGPRFDELDIKVRPLVPFDEESWAVRLADGYVMVPRSEPVFTVMVANAGSGGLEPGVRQVLKALLRPGMRAADVGANVGLLTIAMATAVGFGGRVRAFEPEGRARRQLAKTLHLNGLAQVTLSDAAVGAEAGRLTFHESPVIGHSSLYALPEEEQGAERAFEVEVVRLDDVVPPGEPLDVVKIDVEGAELDVVRGMARLLTENADIAVLAEYGPSHLRRVGIAAADWFGAFAAHGLEPRLIGEPDGRTTPTGPDALADVESANLVFTRPGGAAESRLPK